jgi:xanthine dehydrogenase small subunit
MQKKIRFILNNSPVTSGLPGGTVVLDFLRQQQKLVGTKDGCREGECGACTVLLGEPVGLKEETMRYRAVASCMLPIGEVEGKHLVTIEGINGEDLTPIQQAIMDEGASQCGFCTPGIVMSLCGFFLDSSRLDYEDGIDALDGNICRCTGYASIQRALQSLCRSYRDKLRPKEDRVAQLVEWHILPPYFIDIPSRLRSLPPAVPVVRAARKEGEVVMGGGTDLYIQRPDELAESEPAFISLRPDLRDIKEESGSVYIGAGVTVEEIKESALIQAAVPGIKAYLDLVSSTLMRNRATAAGNIVNASPIGDMTILLLALEGEVVLADGQGRRQVNLKNFFRGYKKLAKKETEIIEWIRFPLPPAGTRFNFEKVSRRKHLDIASVNSAISIRLEGNKIAAAHISAGGVSPIPLYLKQASACLEAGALTAETVRQAAEAAEREIAPIDDVRGAANYKRRLLRQLIYAHFIKLFPQKIAFEDLL